MDGITQGLLGACFGEAVAGHKLGRKAVWYGALGGIIPDFDMITALTHGEWGSLVHHRGLTHSLWFGPVVGSVLGLLCYLVYRRRFERDSASGAPPPAASAVESPPAARPGLPHPGAPGQLGYWIGVWVLSILTHPLLDVFTTYGTQLLAPFDRTRFALNGVGILDPFYSLVLALALVAGARFRKRGLHGTARLASIAALCLTTGYLVAGVSINTRAEASSRAALQREGVEVQRIRAYPTLFQLSLRRIVAQAPGEMVVGYYSGFRDKLLTYARLDQLDDPRVKAILQRREGQIFRWFAMGELHWRSLSQGRDTLVEIDDMRYGQPDHPRIGMWGIRARFDAQGRLVEGPHRFRHRIKVSLAAVWRLFRLAF